MPSMDQVKDYGKKLLNKTEEVADSAGEKISEASKNVEQTVQQGYEKTKTAVQNGMKNVQEKLG